MSWSLPTGKILSPKICFVLPSSRNIENIGALNNWLYIFFSISECQAKSDATLKGTCFSESECSDKGGTKDGNCAQGFGSCCVFK